MNHPELRPAPFVISKLLLKPFGVRYSNFLKRLEFHRTVCDEEESLIQTKTLFQVKQSQDETLHRAEEERRSHNDYKNLVYAVKQKVSAAELSEQYMSLLAQIGKSHFRIGWVTDIAQNRLAVP
jgi:hypothetical protein